MPGHGASDDPSEELGVDGFSSSAIEVLNHLSIEKCHVLGHHGGALIAMNLGWKHPNRIDRIILSGTSGLKSKQEKEAFANRLKKKHDRLEHDGESIFTAWKRYVKYLPDAHPEEVLVTFINNIQTRLRPYDAHSKILEWDRRPALEYLKGPILLMQGDLDNFVSNQESLLDILPKETKRIVINSGGAFMFYDKAELCSLAIAEFIESSSF